MDFFPFLLQSSEMAKKKNTLKNLKNGKSLAKKCCKMATIIY